MKSFFNCLLCLIFCVCLFLLVFQGFAFAALPALGDFCLRLLAAASGQWLVCRIGRNGLHRMLPVVLTSFFAVWGFFLMLTSPSWQHATFGGFLADYVTPAAVCWTVWGLYRTYYK